jgi:hypothetical protein
MTTPIMAMASSASSTGAGGEDLAVQEGTQRKTTSGDETRGTSSGGRTSSIARRALAALEAASKSNCNDDDDSVGVESVLPMGRRGAPIADKGGEVTTKEDASCPVDVEGMMPNVGFGQVDDPEQFSRSLDVSKSIPDPLLAGMDGKGIHDGGHVKEEDGDFDSNHPMIVGLYNEDATRDDDDERSRPTVDLTTNKMPWTTASPRKRKRNGVRVKSYLCDVCNIARFPTYGEAEVHERECAIAQERRRVRAIPGSIPRNRTRSPYRCVDIIVLDDDDDDDDISDIIVINDRDESGLDRGLVDEGSKLQEGNSGGSSSLSSVAVREKALRSSLPHTEDVTARRGMYNGGVSDDGEDKDEDKGGEVTLSIEDECREDPWSAAEVVLEDVFAHDNDGLLSSRSTDVLKMEGKARDGWSAESRSSLTAEKEEGGSAMLVAQEAAGIGFAEEGGKEKGSHRTTANSCRRMALYPVGCPVWFSVRYSVPCSRYLEAETGTIKTVAFDECMRTIVYEIERLDSAVEGMDGPAENYLETRLIVEEEIAFAVKCPVLVKMMDNEDGSATEMNGEIINVTPGVRGRRGEKRTFRYSVLITTDGGVLMEQDVMPDRIQYRYSLEALQSSIRGVMSSSQREKRKAFGIRSNGGQHEPIRKTSVANGNDGVKEKSEEDEKKEEDISCSNRNKIFDDSSGSGSGSRSETSCFSGGGNGMENNAGDDRDDGRGDDGTGRGVLRRTAMSKTEWRQDRERKAMERREPKKASSAESRRQGDRRRRHARSNDGIINVDDVGPSTGIGGGGQGGGSFDGVRTSACDDPRMAKYVTDVARRLGAGRLVDDEIDDDDDNARTRDGRKNYRGRNNAASSETSRSSGGGKGTGNNAGDDRDDERGDDGTGRCVLRRTARERKAMEKRKRRMEMRKRRIEKRKRRIEKRERRKERARRLGAGRSGDDDDDDENYDDADNARKRDGRKNYRGMNHAGSSLLSPTKSGGQADEHARGGRSNIDSYDGMWSFTTDPLDAAISQQEAIASSYATSSSSMCDIMSTTPRKVKEFVTQTMENMMDRAMQFGGESMVPRKRGGHLVEAASGRGRDYDALLCPGKRSRNSFAAIAVDDSVDRKRDENDELKTTIAACGRPLNSDEIPKKSMPSYVFASNFSLQRFPEKGSHVKSDRESR